MKTHEPTNELKKRTNLSLNGALLQEAKELGINISRSAEKGIADAVRTQKQAHWLKENAQAIESSNQFVEAFGLPLAKHRRL